MKKERLTYTICPHCFKKIPAKVESIFSGVFLTRSCPDHGEFKVKLSQNQSYF